MIGPIVRLVGIYVFCWSPLASALGWDVSALMLGLAGVIVAIVASASITAYLSHDEDDPWAAWEREEFRS